MIFPFFCHRLEGRKKVLELKENKLENLFSVSLLMQESNNQESFDIRNCLVDRMPTNAL